MIAFCMFLHILLLFAFLDLFAFNVLAFFPFRDVFVLGDFFCIIKCVVYVWCMCFCICLLVFGEFASCLDVFLLLCILGNLNAIYTQVMVMQYINR